MSAATGAPDPPGGPPGGLTNHLPADRPVVLSPSSIDDESPLMVVEGWSKNEKIKTCKCEVCGDRVRFWSYRCDHCARHICSECLDPLSSKIQYNKRAARNHVMEGCWHRFRSNMHPAFVASRPQPPIRTAEEHQARVSKGLAALTKAAKAEGASKQKPKSSKAKKEKSTATSSTTSIGESDSDYQTSSASKATSSINNSKRKLAAAVGSDQTGPRSTARHKLSKMEQRPASSLSHVYANMSSGEDTVIVGAGIIGMFVARELARETRRAGRDHQITVLDVRSGYCELASGCCNGFLSATGVPEDWNSVTQAAKEVWLRIVSSSVNAEELEFSASTLVKVTEGGGLHQDKSPSWLKLGTNTTFADDDNTIGRVNSTKLAAWLYTQCRLLGVTFRFHSSIYKVYAEDSKLVSVGIEDSLDDNKTAEAIPAANLVLAAGPFTTGVLGRLFPNHSAATHNHVQEGHWFSIKPKAMSKADNVGLRFPHAAPDLQRYDDEISILPRLADKSVTVSGFDTRVKTENLVLEDALRPKRGKPAGLRRLSAPHLNHNGVDVFDKSQMKATGRAQVSIANDDAPIIDAVPAAALGTPNSLDAGGSHSRCVWLCYGFGRYGTLLAPGAARMLVSRMLEDGEEGEEEDRFRLPIYETTRPPAVNGKGKSRV